MTMNSYQRGWVLVTGASSGIGADLARVFGREKRDMVLVARSRERLDVLATEIAAKYGVRVRVLTANLAKPSAAEQLKQTLDVEHIEVETLVNNAGVGLHGPFVELDVQQQSEMISLNVVALTELCRLFAPAMVSRRRGGILNLASTGAFQPGPWMAVYCATKAYVLSFSEALTNELSGTGVVVTCLCPGPTVTNFADQAGVTKTRLFQSGTPMTSLAVAEAGVKALDRGSHLAIPGFKNRMLATLVRFVSLRAAAGIARRFLETIPQ